MNPFGVGATGQNYKWGYLKCWCCHLKYQTKFINGRPTTDVCEECEKHVPEAVETIDATNSRLLAHQTQHLDMIHKITEKMNETWEDNQTLKEQTRAALSSRDRWHEILKEVSDLHGEPLEGDHCQCGLKWPCETSQALDNNRGVARKLKRR